MTKVGRGEPFGWNRVKKRCKKEKRILGLQLCHSELKRLNERLHIHTDDYSSKARPLPIKTGATLWVPCYQSICCLTLSTTLPFYTIYPANIYLFKVNNKYVKSRKTIYQDFDYTDAVLLFQWVFYGFSVSFEL